MTSAAMQPKRVLVESDRVEGTAVYDGAGKHTGTIKRLMIDLESGQVAVSRRDGLAVAGIADPGKQTSKSFLPSPEFVRGASDLLDSIQQHLYDRALAFRSEHTRLVDTKKEFYDFFTPKNLAKPEIHGGFALAHWNGSRAVEEQVKNDLKVTIRCIPFDDPGNPPEPGKCVITGEPSPRRVLWAKSY